MAAPSTPTQVSSIFRGLGITGVHGKGTFDAKAVSKIHRATMLAAQARAKKVDFRMKDITGARAANRSIPNLKVPSSQGKSLISPKLAKAVMDKLFQPSSLDNSMKAANINQMDMSESDMEFSPAGGSSRTPLFGAGGTTGTLGGM